MNKTWQGTYSYLGDRVPMNLKDVVTEFSITIDSFDGRIFQGTIVDNADTGGTPGVGTIDGKITGKKIEFVKQMPISVARLQSGERIVEPSKKHPPIYYTGQIDDNVETAEGTWEIKMSFGLIMGRPAFNPGSTGKWTIKFK